MEKSLAFLGPEGTFGEQAANALAQEEGICNPVLVPCVGLRSVVEHLATGMTDFAVIPVENSVEGGVTESLDSIWSYPKLWIRRALVLPIKHALISSGKISDISEVLSHPQALAQCSNWLKLNLPNTLQLPTSSTAEAVKMVTGSKFRAAIASKSASNFPGVKVLNYPINDVAGNRTRFLLLHCEEIKQKSNFASFAFSLHANAPGALLKALSCIAELGLNMSRIESRPSKRELGEYVFFIDVELPNGEVKEMHQLIRRLEPLCAHLASFGSYPSSELQLD